MSKERTVFEFSNGIITLDNYQVEIKGYYIGQETELIDHFIDYFRNYNFIDTLELIKIDNLLNEDAFKDIDIEILKLNTVSAIQSQNYEEKYAIKPELEKKKKGIFSRFKK